MEQQELERIEGISEPDPPLSHSGYTCLFGIGALIVAVIVVVIAPFSAVFWYSASILSLFLISCGIFFKRIASSEMPQLHRSLILSLRASKRITIFQFLGLALAFFLAGPFQVDHVLWFHVFLPTGIYGQVGFGFLLCLKCIIGVSLLMMVAQCFQALYLYLRSDRASV